MTFDLNKFIQCISRDRLKTYFLKTVNIELEEEQCAFFNCDNKDFIEGIYRIIESTTAPQKDRIFKDFQYVDILTQNKLGTHALKDAIYIQDDPELHKSFERAIKTNIIDFTLNLVLERQKIAQHAFSLYHENNFRNSNKCRRYIIAKNEGFTFLNEEERKKSLGEQIEKIIRQTPKNRFSNIKIEWMPRPQGNQTIQQAIIYRDGMPQTFQTMKGTSNEIHSEIIRPAVTMCIMYNAEKGTVDILGEGGTKQHEQIVQAFKKEITDCTDDHFNLVMKKDIDFSLFKNPIQFEIKPEDNIQSVQIEAIKLRGTRCKKLKKAVRGTFEVTTSRTDPPNMIYNLLQSEYESTYNNRSYWDISKITMRIHFKKDLDKSQYPKQSISFDLMSPNTHNLKNLTNQHEYISEILLERWGIFKK